MDENAALRRQLAQCRCQGSDNEGDPGANYELDYRHKFENAQEAIVVTTPEGRLVAANRAAVELLGAPSLEVLLKTRAGQFYPIAEQRQRFWEALVEHGSVRGMQIDLDRLDGKRIQVLVSAHTRSNSAGEVIRQTAFFRDITERVRLQEALRKREEELASVFASCPDAITVTDLEGQVVDCNQSAVDLHGAQSKEDLIGRSAFELIDPLEHDKASRNLERTLLDGSTRKLEYSLSRLDGTAFQAELSAAVLLDAAGQPRGFVGVTSDITERKLAEAVLRRERDRLELVTEHVGAGIAVISMDHEVVWTNSAIRELFGNTTGPPNHHAPGGSREHCLGCSAAEVLDGRRDKIVKHQLLEVAEGNSVNCHIVASPLRDANGEVMAAVLVVLSTSSDRDTEARIRLDEVQDILEKLEALSEVKSELMQVLERDDSRRGSVETRWLSLDEVAEYLGIKRDTVYKWIRHKDLPAHKIGRLWKFQRSEVDVWLEESEGVRKDIG